MDEQRIMRITKEINSIKVSLNAMEEKYANPLAGYFTGEAEGGRALPCFSMQRQNAEQAALQEMKNLLQSFYLKLPFNEPEEVIKAFCVSLPCVLTRAG